jgi:hypothetical protein
MSNWPLIFRIALCSLFVSGGLAKAQISFPISMSQGPDAIAGIGYMQTSITITSSGQLSATTHTWLGSCGSLRQESRAALGFRHTNVWR